MPGPDGTAIMTTASRGGRFYVDSTRASVAF